MNSAGVVMARDQTKARLVPHLLVSGPQSRQQFLLSPGTTWKVGRTLQNEIILPDDSVSRSHAIIQRAGSGEFYIIDMGSTNGSYVNGARVNIPKTLSDGDRIQIGVYELAFCHDELAKVQQSPDQIQQSRQTVAMYESRLMTVLVVDIRDFTKLAQQVDQTLLCATIGAWFREGGSIMQAHGSWSQKYIGDAIMAIWLHQSPGSETRDILEIFKAYTELAAYSSKLSTQFSLPFPFRIGAGVNTGMAAVGNAGGKDSADFTALGDTVNATFRIESSTKETGVDMAIGAGTYAWLKPNSKLRTQFTSYQVKLKGYDAPTDLWGCKYEAMQKCLARSAKNLNE